MAKNHTPRDSDGIRWKTITLSSGKTMRVAVVRRSGPSAGQPRETKG